MRNDLATRAHENEAGISATEADYTLRRGGREMRHDMDWL